jgi:hypothetical protein
MVHKKEIIIIIKKEVYAKNLQDEKKKIIKS